MANTRVPLAHGVAILIHEALGVFLWELPSLAAAHDARSKAGLLFGMDAWAIYIEGYVTMLLFD